MYDVTMSAYRAKIAQAVGSGTALPKITTVVIGTGGVDANGNPIQPADGETHLYNQVLSKPPSSVTYPSSTQVQFTVTINPGDLPAGTKINEIGLIDSAGTFAEHSTFYTKQTDGTTTMTLSVTLQL